MHRSLDPIGSGRLPDLDLQAVDFELELVQVVLLDEVEDAADVV
jgi:hypothetical protein